jgi:hypothetical protein
VIVGHATDAIVVDADRATGQRKRSSGRFDANNALRVQQLVESRAAIKGDGAIETRISQEAQMQIVILPDQRQLPVLLHGELVDSGQAIAPRALAGVDADGHTKPRLGRSETVGRFLLRPRHG